MHFKFGKKETYIKFRNDWYYQSYFFLNKNKVEKNKNLKLYSTNTKFFIHEIGKLTIQQAITI